MPPERIHDLRWLRAISTGLGAKPHLLIAKTSQRIHGVLPLIETRSPWFGHNLVSLPYVNTAGILADNEVTSILLASQAVHVAQDLNVDQLQLRSHSPIEHPLFQPFATEKCNMRLSLPQREADLWTQLSSKQRNKIRKAQKIEFNVWWAWEMLIPEFYKVFARAMRDLGTPVYSQALFTQIAREFKRQCDVCVIFGAKHRPVAAGMLIHMPGVTLVPSAAHLHQYNKTNVGDLLYYHLLRRAIGLGSHTFDLGRCSVGSGTYVFKKKWGALPEPTHWQAYTRKGDSEQSRPQAHAKAINLWKRLPLPIANTLGPFISKGIP